MAFGDLLKKATSKGLELMNEVAEKGKQFAEEQKAEAERKRVEEENRKEAERVAKQKAADERKAALELKKQKELEEILKPTCEKGDCLWNENKFYFTCPVDCECERKKYTKKDWGTACAIPEFWPYMKRIEKMDAHDAKELDNKSFYDYDEEELDDENFYEDSVELEIYKDFMKEFFPQYGVDMWRIADEFIWNGLGKENKMLAVFETIKNAPEQEDIIEKLRCLRKYNFVNWDYIFEDSFCTNISLYERSLDDFEYTVKLFATVLNEEELQKYFKDISNISVDQLYDTEGKIKPAGLGGPQKGFYGDTLYNTVESWAGEDDASH